MKKFFIITVIATLSLIAHAETARVTGELARDLIDTGFDFNASEPGMGHIYLNIESGTCTKSITDVAGEISCTVVTDNGTVTVSTQDANKGQSASRLRRILVETTQADIKVNATTRQIKFNKIACDSMTLAHQFDDIDLEPGAHCTIEF